MKKRMHRLSFIATVLLGLIFLVSCRVKPVGQNSPVPAQNAPGSGDIVRPEDDAVIEPTPDPAAKIKKTIKLVPYRGSVQHIFFHPLLAYPSMAFDGDYQSNGFDDWFVTVNEFNRVLDSLYKKNFILIDIHSLYDIKNENGKTIVTKKELMLPENKKPLIMSIDDINYYKYMLGNGTVHKLILDENGRIATYSINEKGEKIIAYDNEIVPILDSFVDEHPDFSFRGAKGILAVTGFEGILGYRTDFDSKNHETEREEAIKVVTALKNTGWIFASHGYGHLNTPKHPYEKIVRDTQKWKNEVESLVGPTDVYIYPFGARVEATDPKFQYLIESGFRIFCAVGTGFCEKIVDGAATSDRRHIDGITFRHQRERFLDLFDANEVMDSARPKR